MGESRNYVMVVSALIDAPDWLLGVYREGRCRSMNALHELRKLHAEQPDRVEAWAEGRGGDEAYIRVAFFGNGGAVTVKVHRV